VSPRDGEKHVFQITHVEVQDDGPSDFMIFNDKAGELYLKYDTDTELDFTFPEVGYFQHKKRAVRFARLFQRQWKKGICDATATTVFPYSRIFGRFGARLDQETITAAFNNKPNNLVSLSEAVKLLDSEKYVSVALTKHLALGLGNEKGENWLWFDDEPIAEVLSDRVRVKIPSFSQEIKDYIRDTRDYARSVI
jgi:hypothetical protein